MIPRIPYFQTTRYRVQAMLELTNPQPEEKVADLGAGDGRIVIAFAKLGIETIGFETDEKLAKTARDNIINSNVSERGSIVTKDFWKEDLSIFNTITIYGMPDIMDLLEIKLKSELKKGSRVVSNYYPFPNWKENTVKDNVYLYILS
jgi:ribosomal protein L11 methylase PrmA